MEWQRNKRLSSVLAYIVQMLIFNPAHTKGSVILVSKQEGNIAHGLSIRKICKGTYTNMLENACTNTRGLDKLQQGVQFSYNTVDV